MTPVRPISSDFSVSAQPDIADFDKLAAAGFRSIISSRPDGEEPGQPSWSQIAAAAKAAGLLDWAAARGVPQAKATQCLTDTRKIDEIVNQSGAISQQWPDFQGTPNFVINGTLDNKIGKWDELDAALQKALGS